MNGNSVVSYNVAINGVRKGYNDLFEPTIRIFRFHLQNLMSFYEIIQISVYSRLTVSVFCDIMYIE